LILTKIELDINYVNLVFFYLINKVPTYMQQKVFQFKD